MASDTTVSEDLIEQARKAGGYRTKKAAVTAALEEYVRRRQQLEILKSFGQIDLDPGYDYKEARRRDAHR